MSIRMYVNPDVLTSAGYFPRKGMERDGGAFHGIRIDRDSDDDTYYAEWKEYRKVPAALQPFVLGYRIREIFPKSAERELGTYTDKTATGKLNEFASRFMDEPDRYIAIIDAPTAEDAVALLERIRLGNILPVPGMSYHQPQIPADGKSYEELEAEVKRLTTSEKQLSAEVGRLNTRALDLVDKIVRATRELQSFMDALGWWASWRYRGKVEVIRARLITD